jgi:hypothetical protein
VGLRRWLRRDHFCVVSYSLYRTVPGRCVHSRKLGSTWSMKEGLYFFCAAHIAIFLYCPHSRRMCGCVDRDVKKYLNEAGGKIYMRPNFRGGSPRLPDIAWGILDGVPCARSAIELRTSLADSVQRITVRQLGCAALPPQSLSVHLFIQKPMKRMYLGFISLTRKPRHSTTPKFQDANIRENPDGVRRF